MVTPAIETLIIGVYLCDKYSIKSLSNTSLWMVISGLDAFIVYPFV
jgi:hypothetical protein